MFVRVKKIGPYDYLYLVENARRAAAMRNASRHWGGGRRERVLEDDGEAAPLIVPRQNGETELAVKEVKLAGRPYIVCRNDEAARKDAETRTNCSPIWSATWRKATRNWWPTLVTAGSAAPEGKGFAIDPARVEADAQFDDILVLRTNPKLPAFAVVLRYQNLLAVKQGFLASKALLAARPVFHRTDPAIHGDIFCTFLALVLRKVDQDGRRALLQTAQRASIDPICRALGLTLPPIFQEIPSS